MEKLWISWPEKGRSSHERFGLQSKGARALGECALIARSQAQFPNQALPSSTLSLLMPTLPSGQLMQPAKVVQSSRKKNSKQPTWRQLRRSRRLRRLKSNEYRRHPRGAAASQSSAPSGIRYRNRTKSVDAVVCRPCHPG